MRAAALCRAWALSVVHIVCCVERAEAVESSRLATLAGLLTLLVGVRLGALELTSVGRDGVGAVGRGVCDAVVRLSCGVFVGKGVGVRSWDAVVVVVRWVEGKLSSGRHH